MKIQIIFLLLIFGIPSIAQTPQLLWVKGLESDYEKRITEGTVDNEGNIYMKGFFKDELDFDPSPDSMIIQAAGDGDGYILKLDTAGELSWVKILPSENVHDWSFISLGSKSILTCGDKLPRDVLEMEEYYPGNNGDTIKHFNKVENIVEDRAGNLFSIGQVYSKTDIDPSPNSMIIEPKYQSAAFIVKMDQRGEIIWARQIDDSGFISGQVIRTDQNNHIYVAGTFSGDLDIDPDNPGFEAIGQSAANGSYLAKYSTDGDLIWYKYFNSEFQCRVYDIKVDNENDILIGLNFDSTITFKNFGMDTSFLSEKGSDFILAKVLKSGDIDWLHAFGGDQQKYIQNINIDNNGDIFTTGNFYDTVDFDPTIVEDIYISEGYTDIFIQRFDNTGKYQTTFHIKGPDFDRGQNIKFDGDNNMILMGQYGKEVDFDLSGQVNLKSSTGYSGTFAAKYKYCSDVQSSMDQTICEHEFYEGYNTTGAYLDTFSTIDGCDSIRLLNLTVLPEKTDTITSSICEGEVFEGYSISGTYTDTFVAKNGCDSMRILELEVLPESDPDCSTTNSADPKSILNIHIFPNPTNDFIYFKDNSVLEYQLYNSMGKEVIHGISDKVNMTNLPDGIYFLHFIKDRELYIQKVVKS